MKKNLRAFMTFLIHPVPDYLHLDFSSCETRVDLFKPFSWFSIMCKHTHTHPTDKPGISENMFFFPHFFGVWLEIEFQG